MRFTKSFTRSGEHAPNSFSASTPLLRQQKGYPARKKTCSYYPQTFSFRGPKFTHAWIAWCRVTILPTQWNSLIFLGFPDKWSPAWWDFNNQQKSTVRIYAGDLFSVWHDIGKCKMVFTTKINVDTNHVWWMTVLSALLIQTYYRSITVMTSLVIKQVKSLS